MKKCSDPFERAERVKLPKRRIEWVLNQADTASRSGQKKIASMVTGFGNQEQRTIIFASFASLAEKIFKLTDYSSSKGKVASTNEATNPGIFSVFCG